MKKLFIIFISLFMILGGCDEDKSDNTSITTTLTISNISSYPIANVRWQNISFSENNNSSKGNQFTGTWVGRKDGYDISLTISDDEKSWTIEVINPDLIKYLYSGSTQTSGNKLILMGSTLMGPEVSLKNNILLLTFNSSYKPLGVNAPISFELNNLNNLTMEYIQIGRNITKNVTTGTEFIYFSLNSNSIINVRTLESLTIGAGDTYTFMIGDNTVISDISNSTVGTVSSFMSQ